jgi:hypothetical protein
MHNPKAADPDISSILFKYLGIYFTLFTFTFFYTSGAWKKEFQPIVLCSPCTTQSSQSRYIFRGRGPGRSLLILHSRKAERRTTMYVLASTAASTKASVTDMKSNMIEAH